MYVLCIVSMYVRVCKQGKQLWYRRVHQPCATQDRLFSLLVNESSRTASPHAPASPSSQAAGWLGLRWGGACVLFLHETACIVLPVAYWCVQCGAERIYVTPYPGDAFVWYVCNKMYPCNVVVVVPLAAVPNNTYQNMLAMYSARFPLENKVPGLLSRSCSYFCTCSNVG